LIMDAFELLLDVHKSILQYKKRGKLFEVAEWDPKKGLLTEIGQRIRWTISVEKNNVY